MRMTKNLEDYRSRIVSGRANRNNLPGLLLIVTFDVADKKRLFLIIGSPS